MSRLSNRQKELIADCVWAEWKLLRYAWADVKKHLKRHKLDHLTASQMMMYISLEHKEGLEPVFQQILIDASQKSKRITVRSMLRDFLYFKERVEEFQPSLFGKKEELEGSVVVPIPLTSNFVGNVEQKQVSDG